MNRAYMKARTMFLNTWIGKKIRYIKQINSFKAEKAKILIDETFTSATENEKKAILSDMMNEAKTYNVGFDEYIMYHFKDRKPEERREFVCTRERALYCERLNKPENQMIFDDKGKTYEVFKKYFKRDLVQIDSLNDKTIPDFKEFIDKHPRFIIKPFNGGNGRGIRIVDLSKEGPFEKLCNVLKEEFKDGFVAEELIIQSKELSAVHPDSVNTLRVFTVRFDDRVEFLPFTWRVGTGGNCVDNGGSGGIFCHVDDSGKVLATADEKGRFYEIHPTTNHPLIGFTVPRFEEAKALAKELAMVVPTNRYCGWDIALTDDGWVMQEGNWQGGVVVFQCPMQKGCRAQLDKVMEELGL